MQDVEAIATSIALTLRYEVAGSVEDLPFHAMDIGPSPLVPEFGAWIFGGKRSWPADASVTDAPS